MFDDFSLLSTYFYAENVQHETAVASIMLILLTNRAASAGIDMVGKCPTFDNFKEHKLLQIIDNCYGSCCIERNPSLQELETFRCGHRLDLRRVSDITAIMRRV